MGDIFVLRDRTLEAFAEEVYANKYRANSVWIISPWLSGGEGKKDPIAWLIEALRGSRCSLNLITREPEDKWHRSAVELLWHNLSPSLYYCRTLHAKLYILECDGLRCAMLGSPNLTVRANRVNREIAIVIKTSYSGAADYASQLITDLVSYAKEIVCEDDVAPRDSV